MGVEVSGRGERSVRCVRLVAQSGGGALELGGCIEPPLFVQHAHVDKQAHGVGFAADIGPFLFQVVEDTLYEIRCDFARDAFGPDRFAGDGFELVLDQG